MTFELENLRRELRDLGATRLQFELFESNPSRARASIAQALRQEATNELAYAIALFRSDNFQPDPKRLVRPQNQHVAPDPRYTDDGERIWQAHEVDDGWRRDYLRDCIEAFLDGRDPLSRYEASEDEMTLWSDAMRKRTTNIRFDALTTAQALSAWAEVWGFEDLGAMANPKREEVEIPF